MKRLAILLAMLCCAGADAAQSETHITVLRCKQGGCPIPPMPPAPPTPATAPTPPAAPVAPLPPLPPMDARASLPDLPPMPPAPPAPPTTPMAAHMPPMAPPAPPVLPTVPAGANAACADKAPGYALTWVIRDGEVMMGNCERYKGKMMFTLQSYHRTN